MVRDAFSVLLGVQPDIEAVATAEDGVQAVEKTDEPAPDVVVMDIRMPHMDGIEAARRIAARPGSRTRILILTTFDLDEYVDTTVEQLPFAEHAFDDAYGSLTSQTSRQILFDFLTR
ncbi:response regulator transcription factor [Streptomyces sp. NPDC002466]|uniref:response regulator n=1 Tax=unclassified Streptomyces TaxID=2593676 RepID=UPI0035DAC470